MLSADGASAHGLRPSIVVVDEAVQWPATRNGKKMWAALVSSLGKVAGCRFVVLTSAGEPQHWSFKVLKEARKSRHWRVNEVPGPLKWLDPEELEAQRPLLLDSEFSQYHLNQWVESEDRLVSEADLMAAVVLEGPLQPVAGTRYLVTCDLGLVNDPTVAVVAHVIYDPENRGAPRTVVIDRIARWQGSHRKPVKINEEVEPWLISASQEFNRAPIVIDSWNAAGLVERLCSLGIDATEVKLSEPVVGRIGTSLHLALREHRLHLPNDDKLLSELRGVRLRRTNFGDFRLDHDSGAHDDQAMAIGLAVVELAAAGASQSDGFKTYWKKDVARKSTHPADAPGTLTIAAANEQTSRAIAHRHRREESRERVWAKVQARCSHFWAPPVGEIRTCDKCGIVQDETVA